MGIGYGYWYWYCIVLAVDSKTLSIVNSHKFRVSRNKVTKVLRPAWKIWIVLNLSGKIPTVLKLSGKFWEYLEIFGYFGNHLEDLKSSRKIRTVLKLSGKFEPCWNIQTFFNFGNIWTVWKLLIQSRVWLMRWLRSLDSRHIKGHLSNPERILRVQQIVSALQKLFGGNAGVNKKPFTF